MTTPICGSRGLKVGQEKTRWWSPHGNIGALPPLYKRRHSLLGSSGTLVDFSISPIMSSNTRPNRTEGEGGGQSVRSPSIIIIGAIKQTPLEKSKEVGLLIILSSLSLPYQYFRYALQKIQQTDNSKGPPILLPPPLRFVVDHVNRSCCQQ